MKDNRKGFTLIELLIVIAIIGFLAAAILVAVDPVKRVSESRNAQRWSEVNAILNAVLTKQVDDRAQFDGTVSAPIVSTGVYQVIATGTTELTSVVCTEIAAACPAQTIDSANCIANLSGLAPEWIAEIPVDPSREGESDTDINTGYYISRNSSGRVEIGSCHAELSEAISVRR